MTPTPIQEDQENSRRVLRTMYMKSYYEHGEFFGAAINSKSLRGASKFGIEIRNVMIFYECIVFAFWW